MFALKGRALAAQQQGQGGGARVLQPLTAAVARPVQRQQRHHPCLAGAGADVPGLCMLTARARGSVL